MRLLLLLLLLPISNAVGRPNGKRVTLTVPCGNGDLKLTFDLARISAEMVKASVDFAPENPMVSAVLISGIEQCVEGNPEYKPCGKRDVTAPNFLENAAVNLEHGKKVLTELRLRKVPPELEPAKEFVELGAAFRWAMQERRYQFAKSGDVKIMEEPLLKIIDPAKVCAPAIAKLKSATDAYGRYRTAWFDWNNCVNGAFLDKQGEYPSGPWKAFLAAYAIKAKFLPAEGD